MKILFIGDIVGKGGRETVKKVLPGVREEYSPDLVIA
ncbi:MAG: metallophosphoesterase, partial [Nitrospirae bacterium]|nr:metallophosphoesterase [Nitrospirota bacterium]